MTLDEVSRHPSLSFCSEVELSATVAVYGGMMSDSSMLIHLGDFVKYSDSSPAAMVRSFVSIRHECALIIQCNLSG